MRLRYIRNYCKGSSWDTDNVWTEIQVYNSSHTNVAFGKTVTASQSVVSGQLSYVTNGTYGNTEQYVQITTTGNPEWVQVDLGEIYDDIIFIKIWHYYNFTFINTKTEISEDGINWTTIFDSSVTGTYAESYWGHVEAEEYYELENGVKVYYAPYGTYSWVCPTGVTAIDVLVVGGGGAGLLNGGGGGAGGLIYEQSYSVTPEQSYSITVGKGGISANGSNSTFGALTAIGGGCGSSRDANNATSGGSGGGGGCTSSVTSYGASGTSEQGNSGGTVTYKSNPWPSAGGGGAGGVASDVTSGSPTVGGIGIACDITGIEKIYAIGGDGVNYNATWPTPKFDGYGHGGASGWRAGGSGVVIIKELIQSQNYNETNKSEILSASQSNSHTFTTFVITSLVQDGNHIDLSWAWQAVS